jgi:hypothetical protein
LTGRLSSSSRAATPASEKNAARHYAYLSASKLILGVRSLEKSEAAKQNIVRTTCNANINVWHLDMSDYARHLTDVRLEYLDRSRPPCYH